MVAGPEQPRSWKHSRYWRFTRTLTARLVIGVVTLVVFLVVATGTATYLYLHSFLLSQLDSQVSASASRNAEQIGACTRQGHTVCPLGGTRTPNYGSTADQPRDFQKQWVVQLSPAGEVVSTVQSQPNAVIVALELTASERSALAKAHASDTTVQSGKSEVRVASRSVGDGSFVVTGLSTSTMRDTLHRLFLLELAIGISAIVLAFVVTAGGMALGLGPLKRVTRTAQEVTAELSPEGAGLERRVPDTGSSTEVGQLARSFNTMLDTVQTEFGVRRESEERMRQFLADASHELRTPLTSIRGYAELARMQKARGSESDDDTIGRIETEGTRMSRLVEDLLILARGDDPANTLETEPVDIGDVVADAVLDLQLGFPDRTVTSDVQPGLYVMGDHDQLLRLMRNLTGNAAVHTEPSGPIRVTSQREGDTVVIQVIDAGPGLPPQDAAHVFERFWRADQARTRVRGGSGLGMSIVAQIVAAHGGRAYFDSSVGRGSTVTVILPALG